jgi:hypothetical protein
MPLAAPSHLTQSKYGGITVKIQFAIALSTAALAAAATGNAGAGPRAPFNGVSANLPLEASTLIIEYNSSAEDIGVQFFLDSEGWRAVEILDPDGVAVFAASATGRLLRQGGGTEMFLESVEPELQDLSFAQFFARFPEGAYKFRAIDNAGNHLFGSADFTHDIPAGPVLITPVPDPREDCADNVPRPVVISWLPVTTSIFGDPLNITGYEVIIENEIDTTFDVHLPASVGTTLTVSPELLPPHHDYIFEVLAIEEGGNQTITEGCFTTGS